MTLRFEIEHRATCVYASIRGEFRLGAAKAALSAVLEAAAARREPRVLLDCTGVTGRMDVTDRMEFGAFMAGEQARLAAQLPGGLRVGILAAAPIMDPQRFTQTVATNRGVRMRSSENLQELLSWLEV